jgi:hypothetical protein
LTTSSWQRLTSPVEQSWAGSLDAALLEPGFESNDLLLIEIHQSTVDPVLNQPLSNALTRF